MYFTRLIDKYLLDWANRPEHKPLLLRGARQVGKSTAIRNLGKQFDNFIEINFEQRPEFKAVFAPNLDVRRILSQIGALTGQSVVPGKTLLFLDEIQMCHEALLSLRFFKEDLPELHVVAAGSLLEFAMDELPTFGVGRIRSMFMYPMTFDEFLMANGEGLLLNARNEASPANPLTQPVYERLIELFRVYMLVGGMPEVVAKWASSHDFIQCQEIQDDLLVSYEDDFSKYRKKVDPNLLRATLRALAMQVTKKFVFSTVGEGYRAETVKGALDMLVKAGIALPVTRTAANGLPLGSEANPAHRKYLFLDSGLLLRLLNMAIGGITELTTTILTSSATDLINKGPLAEMIAGLEFHRYQSPNIRHDLYYWSRDAKNSVAEIDYLITRNQKIIPVEVKSGTQGGMKSLWLFMREKDIDNALRCSLENYGEIEYNDAETGKIRHVTVWPLFALSQLDLY